LRAGILSTRIVYRRIGGLEIAPGERRGRDGVYRRIGGLEIVRRP